MRNIILMFTLVVTLLANGLFVIDYGKDIIISKNYHTGSYGVITIYNSEIVCKTDQTFTYEKVKLSDYTIYKIDESEFEANLKHNIFYGCEK